MAKPGKPRKRAPDIERSCLGKRKFMTYSEAAAAARLPLKKLKNNPNGRGGGKLEAYKCHFCDGYHYGHPIRRRI